MPRANIKRIDQCMIKITGIGWKNILYCEFDAINADDSISTEPVEQLRYMMSSATYLEGMLEDYIKANGINIEHALQSVPYWFITDKSNLGETLAGTPRLVFPQPDRDNPGTYILDEYKINNETTERATQESGIELNQAFYCEYEGVEEDDWHRIGRGTDDNRFGDYTFHGTVYPFLYSDDFAPDLSTQGEQGSSGVCFYAGNRHWYYQYNYGHPYMFPVLMIQGSKTHALSVHLCGFGAPYPFYKNAYNVGKKEEGEPKEFVGFIDSCGIQPTLNNSLLEDFLRCPDTAVANDYLNNTLFIQFGKWAEDIDPFDGWGDQDEDNPTGGTGDGMLSNDVIEVLPPTVSAWNKFFTVYSVTPAQLNSFADFCWSPDLIDTMLKFYTSPSDAVLGLMFVPFEPQVSGGREIYLGNVPSGVTAATVSRQFQRLDCGSIFIPEATKTYLDYDPYTKCQIYLPFIGMRQLSMDDFVGKNMGVQYVIDMMTGACVAHVLANGSIRYSFAGSCGISVPITSQDLSQGILTAATTAAGAVATLATGGAAAPAAGAMATTSYGLTNAASAISSGASLANAVKPVMSHGGSVGSATGWMGPAKPFIIVQYPNIAKAQNQKDWQGYPTFRGSQVGGFTGYTQFEAIKLKATKATQEEQEEILSLLKGGVFL